MRSRIRPAGASNTARAGTLPSSSIVAGPVGDTGPSNSTAPSLSSAVSTSRDAMRRPRSPGTRAAGSQTNVTRVRPESPRDQPNHGRMSVLACGAGSGGADGFGALIRSSTAARSVSSGDGAK